MPGSRKSRRTPPPARADVESLVFRWGAQIDPALLDLALTHRSWAHENGGLPTNERLEFLGDSVLSIVVTENLYRAHPDAPEGQLAKMRAATVSEPALAAVARDLGVGEFIKLGKGEALSGGRRKDSILADTVEALIGAAYLTHGLEPTREVVTRLVSRFLSAAPTRGAGAGLEDEPAGADRRPPPGQPLLRGRRRGPGPQAGLHGHGAGRRASPGPGDWLVEEGGRARRRRGRLRGAPGAPRRRRTRPARRQRGPARRPGSARRRRRPRRPRRRPGSARRRRRPAHRSGSARRR